MGISLILAEKPDQAKHYSEAFKTVIKKDGYFEIIDNEYFKGKVYLTWGFGHLVKLIEPEGYKAEWKKWDLKDLPIFPEKFKFEVDSSKRKQFNIVKKLLNEADEIIIGTDSDREGENIAYSIIRVAGAIRKPTKRLWVNSMEVKEIQRGFKNLRPGQETYKFYTEASTRQCSDWLIGMNISRLYSLLLQQKGLKGGYSLGRVQTPTLYMIYNRVKEIKNFVSKPFFEVYADVKVKNGTFKAKYNEKFDTKDDVQNLFTKNNIQEKNKAIIEDVQKEIKKQKSPKLHSLSTLQSKANKNWKYSPKKVLDIMQSLYLKKLLSYPRTDCNFITENEFEYLIENVVSYQKIANKTFNIAFKEPQIRYVNNKEVQEHYAIIPTKTIPSDEILSKLSEEEKNIYFEILYTTLAMFAENYEYEETKISVNIKDLIFNAIGKIEKNKGWKVIFDLEENPTVKKEEMQNLPNIEKNEEGSAIIKVHEGATKPPKMYTEGNLINMMKTAGKTIDDKEEAKILNEVEGIGTEATRAQIIETLKNKEYIEVVKNTVNITKKGEIICEAVNGTLISSAEMTAKWETDLKKIGNGKGDQRDFFNGVKQFVIDQLKEATKTINNKMENKIKEAKEENILCKCPSPSCSGNIRETAKAYSCDRWKDGCKFTIWKTIAGKKINPKQALQLIEKGKTNEIKGFKNNKGEKFAAYLKLENNKVTFIKS